VLHIRIVIIQFDGGQQDFIDCATVRGAHSPHDVLEAGLVLTGTEAPPVPPLP
jgi:hypothetical protein